MRIEEMRTRRLMAYHCWGCAILGGLASCLALGFALTAPGDREGSLVMVDGAMRMAIGSGAFAFLGKWFLDCGAKPAAGDQSLE